MHLPGMSKKQTHSSDTCRTTGGNLRRFLLPMWKSDKAEDG